MCSNTEQRWKSVLASANMNPVGQVLTQITCPFRLPHQPLFWKGACTHKHFLGMKETGFERATELKPIVCLVSCLRQSEYSSLIQKQLIINWLTIIFKKRCNTSERKWANHYLIALNKFYSVVDGNLWLRFFIQLHLIIPHNIWWTVHVHSLHE